MLLACENRDQGIFRAEKTCLFLRTDFRFWVSSVGQARIYREGGGGGAAGKEVGGKERYESFLDSHPTRKKHEACEMGPSVLSEKKGPYHVGSIRRATPTPPSSFKARRHPKRPSITSTLHATTRHHFVCSSHPPSFYFRVRLLLWGLLAATLTFGVMQQMISFRWLRGLFGFEDQQPAAPAVYPSQVLAPEAARVSSVSVDDGGGGLWRGDRVDGSELANMDVTELVTGVLATNTVRTSKYTMIRVLLPLMYLQTMYTNTSIVRQSAILQLLLLVVFLYP